MCPTKSYQLRTIWKKHGIPHACPWKNGKRCMETDNGTIFSKGEASNIVLNDETLLAMQEKADQFLKQCMEGKNGTQIIYEIRSDGGIRRIKYR